MRVGLPNPELVGLLISLVLLVSPFRNVSFQRFQQVQPCSCFECAAIATIKESANDPGGLTANRLNPEHEHGLTHMKLWPQIFAGSLMLGACSLIHIFFLWVGLELMILIASALVDLPLAFRWIVLILFAFATALAGHTAQIWFWAVTLKKRGVFQSTDNAVYFSLVTTTTLGYGDITLEPEWRVYGAMAAVTGLLTFGLSTAFLVGVMSQFMKSVI